MTKLREVTELGQAIWLDYIRRAFIESGELQKLIDEGLRGITSNPSIFEKAITGSADYDDALPELVEAGKSAAEIFEALAIADIQRAADLLRPIYDELDGQDGYVSLEVGPDLAYDTEGTIEEARRLFAAADRPNVFVKVPATAAGIPAIAALIGEGINVNITLMFSLAHYDAVSDAYIRGIERWSDSGGDPSRVASVASFFVSRVDTAVDNKLDEIGNESARKLKGKIGIANAKMAYARYLNVFGSERWQRLAAKGARPQRVLWASTSVKDPEYPDTLYVDNLMGANTINTLPLATIDALRDHATVASGLTNRLEEARQQINRLYQLGVNLEVITQQLQSEGVEKFAESIQSLMVGITEKCERLQGGQPLMETHLGPYQEVVAKALAQMGEEDVIRRIWSHDHTLWKPDPTEISNRLGWLHTPDNMDESVARLQTLVKAVRADGYTDVLLIGMGGSSLAPEVFYRSFGDVEDALDLAVLDTTDPDAIRAYEERLDPAKTLFIVSTKSGGTVETLSGFKYFYNWVVEAVGDEAAGDHFIAITDPGSKLVDIARKYHFRDVFLNDPTIGGRYSALSYFGLVPAALVGVDVARLLDRAQAEACNADACNDPVGGDNRAAQLGAIMAELAKAGRDKLTIIASPPLASFGDWVEQLIAESTGKEGKGILPIVGEPVLSPEVYGDDRLFVYLRLEGDDTYDDVIAALAEAGQPVVELHLRDLYDLGRQFFLWEMATAVAGHRLGIQPFDQPNVESAKVRAREMVAAYSETGELPQGEAAPLSAEALHDFLAQVQPGDYISLQAYVPPTAETDEMLQALRRQLLERYRLATTVGYGPRFLHSTGQLHKGDAGNGLFIQFTSDPTQDVAIPDEAGKSESSMTFGVLKMAQALGDAQALLDENRRLIRFHVGTDVVGGLKRLMG